MGFDAKEKFDSITAQSKGLQTLMQKALSDLTWEQMSDPSRRSDLINKGRRQLRGIFASGSQDTSRIQERILGDLESFSRPNGLSIYRSVNVPIAAVVFPYETRVQFSLNSYCKRDTTSKPDLLVKGTTYTSRRDTGKLPEEGYQDETGIVVPFKERADIDKIQHGGFFIDKNQQNIEVVNYEILKEKASSLKQGESVLEANWHIDSDNQDTVAARNNLQFPNVFNTFGSMNYNDGSRRLFSLNNCELSYFDLSDIAQFPIENVTQYGTRTVTVREMAGMANIIAGKVGAVSWAMCGLEFIGGGTYAEEMYLDGNHFQIYF
jgi:hypothetical protein